MPFDRQSIRQSSKDETARLRLLEAVEVRISRFQQTKDPGAVCGREADLDAAALISLFSEERGKRLIELHTLGTFCLLRARVSTVASGFDAYLRVGHDTLWAVRREMPALVTGPQLRILETSVLSSPSSPPTMGELAGFLSATMEVLGKKLGPGSGGLDQEASKVAFRFMDEVYFGLTKDPRLADAVRKENRAIELMERYEKRHTGSSDPSGKLAMLAEVIDSFREAKSAYPDGHPDQGPVVAALVKYLSVWTETTGDPAARDEMITLQRSRIAHTSAQDGGRAVVLTDLAIMLRQRGTLTDLNEAVRAHADAVAAFGPATKTPYLALKQYGMTLNELHARTRDPAVQDRAVDVFRRAAELGAGQPALAEVLYELGSVLTDRYKRTGDSRALDESVAVHRRCAALCPPGHPDHARARSNLALALTDRHDMGDAEALEEAIGHFRVAVAAIGADGEDLPLILMNFARALLKRGRDQDVDEIVALCEKALADPRSGGTLRARTLATLGAGLTRRFERTGADRDLDGAITALRESVALTPQSADALPNSLMLLALALRQSYERAGELPCLTEAVSLLRLAVELSSTRTGRRDAETNLGLVLGELADATADSALIEEAIGLYRRAARAFPVGSPGAHRAKNNLGGALLRLYRRNGDPELLSEALRLYGDLVQQHIPGEADRAAVFSGFGAVLRAKYEQMKDRRAERHTPFDVLVTATLDAAIVAHRTALESLPVGHTGRGYLQFNVGAVLVERCRRGGDPSILWEATDLLRTAARDQQGTAGEGISLHELGAALVEAWRNGHLDSADHAIATFTQVSVLPTASTSTRIEAAVNGGTVALSVEDVQTALEAFGTSVELLPQLAGRHLGREDAEHWLARFGGLASDAAACAIELGRPERAITLLELGRGVLLAQSLDTRTDLTDLDERHPELARRFSQLCDQLDADGSAPGYPRLPVGLTSLPAGQGSLTAGSGGLPPAAGHRAQLAEEFHELVYRIRRETPLKRFLQPPTVEELTAEAQDGPIVVVNTSTRRCDALLLTRTGIDVVRLPGLSIEELSRRIRSFQGSLAMAGHPALGGSAQAAMARTLEWLWDAVAEPVLTRLTELGLLAEPGTGGDLPRMWWVPTGQLGFLPLHAAGYHGVDGRSVLDRVVSSYAPTVRSLRHHRTREPAACQGPARVVACAVPQPPGSLKKLPGTLREVGLLAELFPGTRVLTGAEVTHDALAAALPTADWAHFACHGLNYGRAPSRSALVLHDHDRAPMTVLDISRMRLPSAEFAYLSACSTMRTGAGLSDEAIHITGAFQLAGYRNVVGTLWSIRDDLAVDMAERVYTPLAHGAPVGDEEIARALHAATTELRARHRDEPAWWAAHVHVGG